MDYLCLIFEIWKFNVILIGYEFFSCVFLFLHLQVMAMAVTADMVN
jgi:hypothetical protein